MYCQYIVVHDVYITTQMPMLNLLCLTTNENGQSNSIDIYRAVADAENILLWILSVLLGYQSSGASRVEFMYY